MVSEYTFSFHNWGKKNRNGYLWCKVFTTITNTFRHFNRCIWSKL